MKKLLLTFGVLMIAGAAMSATMASRYDYHLQQYPYYNQYYPNLKYYRPHSDRLAPWQRKSQSKVTCYRGEPCFDVALESEANNRNRQAQPHRPGNTRVSLDEYKRARASQNPRYPNTYQSQRLYIRANDYVERGVSYTGHKGKENTSIVVSESSDFALNISNFQQDGSGVYRSKGTSLAFRVTKTPSTYRCAESNFWNCASNLNKQLKDNRTMGSIFNQGSEFRWNQTNGLDFTYYPTMTESFDTLNGSRAYTFFSFNALNPSDGRITRIDGVANTVNKEEAAKKMFRIMESFRFKN